MKHEDEKYGAYEITRVGILLFVDAFAFSISR